jgi:hypothetical protein
MGSTAPASSATCNDYLWVESAHSFLCNTPVWHYRIQEYFLAILTIFLLVSILVVLFELHRIVQYLTQSRKDSKMSIFGNVEHFFEKLFGSKATWERTASVALTVAAPLTEEVVQLALGTPAETVVKNVIAQVQNDMAAAATLAASATGVNTKQKVTNLLNGINQNLSTLLADVDVKNSQTALKLSTAITTLTGELSAIIQVS